MKCVFRTPADSICISCQRRGAECVGQQFPEVVSTSLDRSLQMGDRVVRVETLVEKLLQRAPDDTVSVSTHKATRDKEKPTHSILTPSSTTPASTNSTSPQLIASYKTLTVSPRLRRVPQKNQTLRALHQNDETAQYELLDGQSSDGPREPQSTIDRLAGPGSHEGLSKALHESSPTPQDIKIIAGARGKISTRFFQMMTTTYKDLDRADVKSLESLLETPGSSLHPVLIARHMLWVATFLQHLHPHLHNEAVGLSEPPRQMTKRLVDTCIRLVTTNDDLLGSVEGLECVMIESMYHTNGGNLRKGFIAIRRAMVIAQLMGFHRPGIQAAQCPHLDPETQPNPSFIWYRILFSERHLCLMLGLPQSTLDHSMASEVMLANDSPMGRLERIHCTIASRILERNQSDPSSNDVTLTQELDGELQEAADDLPRKWWLSANLATVVGDPEALFWDMRRLFHQLFHYNLLNQLHLPYMLRSNSTGDRDDFSRITCVNASREVLSRFMMFQSIDRIAFWCRTMHYFSLMAAMTLIIAHLDGHRRCASFAPGSSQQQQKGRHRRKTENLLTHQRPGDRAMVEQVQESMGEMSRLNKDTLGAQSAELLRKLLVIEAEASMPATREDQAGEFERDQSSAVRVHIPHFGAIKISPDGIISKELSKDLPSTACAANQIQQRQTPHTGAVGSGGTSTQVATYSSCFDSDAEGSKAIHTAPSDMTFDRDGVILEETEPQVEGVSSQSVVVGDSLIDAQYDFPTSSTFPEVLLQQGGNPQATGFDDWTLQGVDMAFFDSLMREVGDLQ